MKNLLCILVISLLIFQGCASSKPSEPAAPDHAQSLPTVNISDLVPQAVKIIESGLYDQNPVIRSNAAEAAGAAKQLDLMPRIQKMAVSDVVPVQFASIMTLGDVKYAPAQPALKRLLTDDNANIRAAAVYALSQLGQRGYERILSDNLKSANATVKANTILVIGKMKDRRYLEVLRAVLNIQSENDRVRFQTVETLASLGDEKIYPKIWTMLISAYADDRVIGIRAMGALNTQPARNALVTVLDNEIVEVRLAAAEQLAIMGENTGEPVVLDFLTGKGVSPEERNSVRAQALAALAIGQIGTEALKSYLPELLSSKNPPVQLAAAKAVLILHQKELEKGI